MMALSIARTMRGIENYKGRRRPNAASRSCLIKNR